LYIADKSNKHFAVHSVKFAYRVVDACFIEVLGAGMAFFETDDA